MTIYLTEWSTFWWAFFLGVLTTWGGVEIIDDWPNFHRKGQHRRK